MKTQSRFIKSIVATSKETSVEMPWTRGARRAEWIAKRDLDTKQSKVAQN